LLSVLSGNSTLALRAGFAFAVRGLALSQCHSVLDHFVIGGNDVISMAERGLM